LGQYTRTAIWLTESPYQSETEERIQAFYRFAFVNERRMVDRLREHRHRTGHPYPDDVYYLAHAYDPERHYPRDIVPDVYRSDVCFIGSPFPERRALLNAVDWSGIDTTFRGVFDDDDLNETLDRGGRTSVSNDEAQLYYAGASIVLNHHRVVRYYGSGMTIDEWEAESINPRPYELAAGRVFQVCDDSRAELRDLFGESIPTYRHHDPRDLERVIRYWLDRPDERRRLAADAHARVQGHTVAARMREVLDICLG
jgi:spore maturation protein CgeB